MLGVLGTSVVVAGTEHGGRLPVAVALVLAQVCALRWLVRAPVAVLAATAPAGLAVWALLPAVTLTGALLAAQIALCVLSAVMPRRVSLGALAAMCLPAPLAFGAGGAAGLAVFVLTVVLAWTAGQWRRAQRARTRAETRRAVLEERARIAREVHDVVAHTLSVVVVQAGAADDVFSERPDQARQALRAIETGARSALGELRLLLRAFGSDAEAPEDGGGDGDGDGDGDWRRTPSLARLDELADAVRAAGLAVHVSREGPLDGLPAAVDLAAYRIVQEALTNALRHAAGADEVRVRVVADEAGVRLTVVDNGRTRRRSSADHARPEAPAGRTPTAGPDGPTSPRGPDGPGSTGDSNGPGSARDSNGPGSARDSNGPGSGRGSDGVGSPGDFGGPGSGRGPDGLGSAGGSDGPASPRGSFGPGSARGSDGLGSAGGSDGPASPRGYFGPGSVGVGRGVVGMRERARLVGGSLRAGPLPGGGFEVAARLPVEDVS
ncbi:histidine kinase [Streptomyces arenae]|uniref:sensor histidine kinase n=1 Tax=Streptomyces arenae TaxID=29301 RepID=UPI002657CAAF|nr:histidine kinase [Streptomyces arenae]MCG7206792.1 histidine kinase [Streptomyces arenae]